MRRGVRAARLVAVLFGFHLRKPFGAGLALLGAACAAACATANLQAAVSLRFSVPRGTPGDAQVIIDEQYVGHLSYVAARGVRLPVGQHRITVKKQGYFPWDKLVVADRYPIELSVVLVEIPD